MVSRRIVAVKVIVVLPKNIGEGSQLTCLKPTDTVTETGAPATAELGGLGDTVTVALLMLADDRY